MNLGAEKYCDVFTFLSLEGEKKKHLAVLTEI